jgi:hypothetical protein
LLDSSAGYFDAVIGWTIGFEREYMRTYQEQRYAARLSLTDNERHETYCLMDGRYVELVRRYMSLVRRDCTKCGASRTVDAFGPGLYPFNEAFLRRVYENLIADDRQRRRTPRHLLDRALKRYLEIAATDGSYPPLKQPVNVREILYDNAVDAYREEYPPFAALMAWYGVEREGMLCLSDAVPRNLGVLVPDEFQGQDEICLGLGQSTPITVDVADQALLAKENQLKELYLELQEWFAGADLLEHVEVFRRGAYKILTALKYDLPLRLENPAGSGFGYGAPLVYGRDRPETNVYIEGTRLQKPPMEVVVLSRDSERWSEGQLKRLMQTMAYVDLFDEFPEDADWALLGDWAAAAFGHYSRRVERLLDQNDRLKMPLEQFVLAAKFLLVNYDRGLAEPVYAALAAPLDEATPTAQELLPQGVEYTDALQLRALIDGAFQSLFYLSRDQVDYARLSSALADFYPDVSIGHLRRVSAYRVDPGGNFRVDGHTLEEMVLAFKKLSYALDVADFRLAFRRVREELQAIAEACEEPLRQVIQRIGSIRNQLNQYDLYESLYSQGHWSAWDEQVRAVGNETPATPGTGPDALRTELQELLALPTPQNVFQYIAFARRADAVVKDRHYRLLLAARRLLGDLQERLGRQRMALDPLKGPDEVMALAARLAARLTGRTAARLEGPR